MDRNNIECRDFAEPCDVVVTFLKAQYASAVYKDCQSKDFKNQIDIIFIVTLPTKEKKEIL